MSLTPTSTSLPQKWLPTAIPWVPCFEDIGPASDVTWTCANLTVPIDYLDPTNNQTTQIGLAKAHPNELEVSERILFFENGGPGGSSIFLFANETSDPQLTITDFWLNITGRQQDVIMLEQRGVTWSNFLSCDFTTESFDQFNNDTGNDFNLYSLQNSLLTNESVLFQVELQMESPGPFCANGENLEYLAHINTPNVVRDFDLVRSLEGVPQFDYWGISYGTVIGTMYAAMFPQNVGRIILDGVVNFPLWVGLTGNAADFTFGQLINVLPILNRISALCVAAAQVNPQACPFAVNSLNATDPTADVNNRINNIIDAVAQIGYWDPLHNVTINYASLAGAIIGNMYGVADFPNIYIALQEVEEVIATVPPGGQETITPGLKQKRQSTDSSNATNSLNLSDFNEADPISGFFNPFTFYATACQDWSFDGIDTAASLSAYISGLISQNTFVGAQTIDVAGCLSWPDLSAFDLQKFNFTSFPATLNTPVLVLSSINDPITPFPGGQATFEFLGPENAALVQDDGFGHSTLANPNECMHSVIRAFIENGTLPANGTTCHTDNSGANNPFLEALNPDSFRANSSSNFF